MALKLLSSNYFQILYELYDKKNYFGYIDEDNNSLKENCVNKALIVKIQRHPCSISFSAPKSWFTIFKNQENEPQLMIGELLNIDCSNIKIPSVPPRKPEKQRTYVPEVRSWEVDSKTLDKNINRQVAAMYRDEFVNERAQAKFEERLAKFEERVRNAQEKIFALKKDIRETFSGYTFYIYKNNIYYFNAPDIHSHEDQKLLIKKYWVRQQKQLDKFKKELEIVERLASEPEISREPIPESVRMFVWRRDKGKCVKCGSNKNLEFDHIIPVSKGGSNTERNIQILCEICNREKSDKI